MLTKPIGGFFGLETKNDMGYRYHGHDLLSSGRVCLRYFLEKLGCRKLYLPFFICDSVIKVAAKSSVELEYYGLDIHFRPVEGVRLQKDEYFMYVNYYGINQKNTSSLMQQYGKRLIIDNTHAFFDHMEYPNPSFNSARKFFGVPDGAYLNTSVEDYQNRPFNQVSIDHLVNKNRGLQKLAFKQYRNAEKQFGTAIKRVNPLTDELLGKIDYDKARTKRRENFLFLHDGIGVHNRLNIDLEESAVPYCYPFLPGKPLDRSRLLEKKIYFPLLWPEVLNRDGSGIYETERMFAEQILCLPIDQRYSTNEMRFIAEKINLLL